MDIQLSPDDIFADPDTSNECLQAVRNNGLLLQFCENQTYELCREAVIQNPFALQYVYPENLDRPLWRLAFSKDASSISVLDEPSDACIHDALTFDGLAIRSLRHFKPEHARIAVRQNGLALQYIHEQTEDLCLEALRQTSDAVMFVAPNWQTDRVCLYALEQNSLFFPNIHAPTDQMKRLALMEDGHILQWIRPMTVDYCKLAMETAWTSFQFVPESFRSDLLLRFAVEQSVDTLQYVRDAPEWLLRYAFTLDPERSKYYMSLDTYNRFKSEWKPPLLIVPDYSSSSPGSSCKGGPSWVSPNIRTKSTAVSLLDDIESFSENEY